jgi:hypothetical protein
VEYIQSGVTDRAWTVKKQNVYAHYARALGRDEELVSQEAYSTIVVQRAHAKVTLVPSGAAINFALQPAADGGEQDLISIWTRIRAAFGEDMAREQWRLTYMDRDGDESVLFDGSTVEFAVEQALRGSSVLCMRLSPKLATVVPPSPEEGPCLKCEPCING